LVTTRPRFSTRHISKSKARAPIPAGLPSTNSLRLSGQMSIPEWALLRCALH
jgi:hypothetical protein